MRWPCRSIAEIGKERIRRVIKNLANNAKGQLKFDEQREDLGFRVFKLAESHYRCWAGTEEQDADDLSDQMEMFDDPLQSDWEPQNVIYEVLLKEGYSLTSCIEKLPKKEADKNTICRVTDDDRDQSFLICLDGAIDAKTPQALKLRKDDLFICRDAALSDELAANLALQCRLKTL